MSLSEKFKKAVKERDWEEVRRLRYELRNQRAKQFGEKHLALANLLGEAWVQYEKRVEEGKLHYHAMVKEEIWIPYQLAVRKVGGDWIEFQCYCQTKEGQPHYHAIIFLPKEVNPNSFNKSLNRSLEKQWGILDLPPWKRQEAKRRMCPGRKYYNKPITNRVHFIHTCLYMQTVETNGCHEGILQDCKHTKQTVKHTLPNKKEANKFRNQVLLPLNPGMREEMEKAWEELLEKRRQQRNKRKLSDDTMLRLECKDIDNAALYMDFE